MLFMLIKNIQEEKEEEEENCARQHFYTNKKHLGGRKSLA